MITIWGTSTCSYCKKARDVCEQYGLDYEYILIDSQEKLAELHEKVPGTRTVPQIFWFDKYIGGYTELMEEIENTRSYGDGKI